MMLMIESRIVAIWAYVDKAEWRGSTQGTMQTETPTTEPPGPNKLAARLADLTAVTHLAFVTFVVWVEGLVLLGAVLGWEWIRDPVLRLVHFALVAYVGIQDLMGKVCPLTTWERQFRLKAGQETSEQSFIGKVVHQLLMCDLDEQALRRIRLTFALIVTITLFVVWPRFH
jgi:hypothetical protein